MDSIQQDASFDLFIPNVKDDIKNKVAELKNDTLIETPDGNPDETLSTEVKQISDEDKQSEWGEIDKQMKTHDTNNASDAIVDQNGDPSELKSFTIDEMLKDIEDNDINNGDNKIIDLKSEKDYQIMTVSQLKDILIENNLPVSGNKTKLIQRILDN